MSTSVDVAIIGAGAYGLSLAAHLRAAGVEFRIFGKTMGPWKTNMPPGMLLKSHPWSSCIYDPASEFTLQQFCIEQGIAYHESLMPLPLETFVAYGEAFQARLVPEVEPKLLVGLEPAELGFRATFDDGESVIARRVVLAVGVHPFKYVPPMLRDLPAELLSHSGDYGPLGALADKDVTVLGSGASATDLAALLHEKGARVSLVARAAELYFSILPRQQRSWWRQVAHTLKPLVEPGSGIGSGWYLKICADAPWVFHALPERTRLRLVRTTLGPLGHSSMRERVVGKVPLFLGHHLESAERRGDKIDLRLATRDGRKETLQADHLVAATGYRIDLGRLAFLDRRLLAAIRMVEDTPVLSGDYESSVRGLYFVGAASANSFGPVTRFVFGAIHPARRVARHLSTTVSRSSGIVSRISRVPSTAL
jgi:cation diffusion facilitator CzcD-associated flavoprotein CzcO